MKDSEQVFSSAPYLRRRSALDPQRLAAIDDWLQALLDEGSSSIRKTHYFHGRYENLYIDTGGASSGNPDLDLLLKESLDFCADMLDTSSDQLRIGFWFNRMEPGQVTTLHRHDDFDELISGVVYLKVPEDSGDLVLVLKDQELKLTPVMGNFVYFSPETPHKVEPNRSNERRLAIGMNIGPAHGEFPAATGQS
jgi:mannose-6-phosphate isomerase-like protein (cupin superfamily)